MNAAACFICEPSQPCMEHDGESPPPPAHARMRRLYCADHAYRGYVLCRECRQEVVVGDADVYQGEPGEQTIICKWCTGENNDDEPKERTMSMMNHADFHAAVRELAILAGRDYFTSTIDVHEDTVGITLKYRIYIDSYGHHDGVDGPSVLAEVRRLIENRPVNVAELGETPSVKAVA